ncbi:MAG: PKD domain-containing protein [Patescibacteria group bacterium]|mgnify:CR=1 FL=1
MKRVRFIAISALTFILFSATVFADDLILQTGNVKFSVDRFIEGKAVRIYATVASDGKRDMRGVVRFSDNGDQIQGDQPISVIAGKDDAVYVDWSPLAGEHTIKVAVFPFDSDDDNAQNNSAERKVTVLADTDRDGTPNADDADDDNDGTVDTADAFPLNKNESTDSDGDTIGNNKDDDDDNDSVKDQDDQVPLNANETLDTDKDGIGNNEDTDDDGDSVADIEEIKKGTNPLNADSDGDSVNDKEDAYPLDPAQARDFDRDGIGDAKDNDADNDGIPKDKDVNDTNKGPEIHITSTGKSSKSLAYPNEPISFETTTSLDPDGKIANTEWSYEGQKATGPVLKTTFQKPGIYKVVAKVTDDKGEAREKTFKVYVMSPVLPWLLIAGILLIIILAIFLFFFYTHPRKARRNRFERVTDILDTILKFLPKAPKGKK